MSQDKRKGQIVGETQSQIAMKIGNRIQVYSNLQQRQSCIIQDYKKTQ